MREREREIPGLWMEHTQAKMMIVFKKMKLTLKVDCDRIYLLA